MLRDRLAIAILLIPLALWMIALGGVVYWLAVSLIFTLAAREYGQLFRAAGQRPAGPLIVAGTLLLIAAQQFPALNPSGLLFALAILAPMAWHLVDYERGAETAGSDFVISLAGIFYLGWLGGYFISLRALPDGEWWLLTALCGIWLADTAAYSIGRVWGRHQMSPRLSPKKTWEGFAGSLAGGAAGAGLLAVFWSSGAGAGSLLTWQTGAALGFLTGLLGPLGDLGVSMLKRQMGVKDSGALLAGHGGALDRMDSWLVAVPVGYYFVLILQAIRR